MNARSFGHLRRVGVVNALHKLCSRRREEVDGTCSPAGPPPHVGGYGLSLLLAAVLLGFSPHATPAAEVVILTPHVDAIRHEFGREAGQAGVGDLFAWFMEQGVPVSVQADAKRARLSVYEFLERRAAALQPGESGLLALDWWNGCRSVLMDSDLSGMLVGATLATKPHEIYRALIEATAFGTRKIIEAFTSKGVAIDELYGCGGLAQKNPLLMQIYSDVTGRPIKVAESEQTSALGAAMHGAVAAGFYPDIHVAARKLARVKKKAYTPNPKAKPVYDQLYAEYTRLHDFFGRDPGGTMKTLRRLRRGVLSDPR